MNNESSPEARPVEPPRSSVDQILASFALRGGDELRLVSARPALQAYSTLRLERVRAVDGRSARGLPLPAPWISELISALSAFLEREEARRSTDPAYLVRAPGEPRGPTCPR